MDNGMISNNKCPEYRTLTGRVKIGGRKNDNFQEKINSRQESFFESTKNSTIPIFPEMNVNPEFFFENSKPPSIPVVSKNEESTKSDLNKWMIISGIIVFFLIIFIIIITLLIIFLTSPNNKCSPGLKSEDNMCVVPIGLACLKEFNCEKGSQCINNICTIPPVQPLPPPSVPFQPAPPPSVPVPPAPPPVIQPTIPEQSPPKISDKDKTDLYFSNFNKPFRKLSISNSIESNPLKFISENMLDAFYYCSRIFIIFSDNPNKICSYDTNGNLCGSYATTIPIRTSIEVIGNSLYTIHNGMLFEAIFNINNQIINFLPKNEMVQFISANTKNEKLYRKKNINDSYIMLGSKEDYIIIDHKFVYYFIDGQTNKIEHYNKYPFYHEGKLYLYPYKIKGYSDMIFLHFN